MYVFGKYRTSEHIFKSFDIAFKPFFQCPFWTRYKDIHSLLSQICTIPDELAQWLNAKVNANQKFRTWAQNLIVQVKL